MLMPPIPFPDADDGDLVRCLDDCFEMMDAYNARVSSRCRSRIEYVSDELLEALVSRSGGMTVAPMNGDYVYDMARMIDLAGGKLKSKRHAKTRFMREFPSHRTVALAHEHVPACLDLLRLWRQRGDETHQGEMNDAQVAADVLRQRDTLASELLLESWLQLGCQGMALFVDDQLVGFTIGEKLSATQASILVEKTHPDYPGAAQFIFAEFCRQYWSEFPECNVGDDWGIPSLRFTKESYQPIKILPKHVLTRPAAVMTQGFAVEPSSAAIEHDAVAASIASESVAIRAARVDDESQIRQIEALCFDAAGETFSDRQVHGLVGNPRAAVFVAETGGRVVGWVAALVRRHQSHRSGRLYAVAVHPQEQGKGLGRRLAEHALAAIAAQGVERVFLEVRQDNERAIRLYESQGFVRHDSLPNYYGPGIDAVRMRRIGRRAPPLAPAPAVATSPLGAADVAIDSAAPPAMARVG